MKPTDDDILEAKKVYFQLSFERYQGELVLRNLSPPVYIPGNNRLKATEKVLKSEQNVCSQRF